MKSQQIKIKSKEHSEAVQRRLFELGYEWYSGAREVQFTDHHSTPTLSLHHGVRRKYICRNKKEKDFAFDITLDDLYGEKKEVVVENITKEYDAVVSKSHIQVGCQKITYDKFDELVAAVEEIRGK